MGASPAQLLPQETAEIACVDEERRPSTRDAGAVGGGGGARCTSLRLRRGCADAALQGCPPDEGSARRCYREDDGDSLRRRAWGGPQLVTEVPSQRVVDEQPSAVFPRASSVSISRRCPLSRYGASSISCRAARSAVSSSPPPIETQARPTSSSERMRISSSRRRWASIQGASSPGRNPRAATCCGDPVRDPRRPRSLPLRRHFPRGGGPRRPPRGRSRRHREVRAGTSPLPSSGTTCRSFETSGLSRSDPPSRARARRRARRA